MALLEVQNLSTAFHTDAGHVRAVDGVSFSLERGSTLGLVGESGCGKSVTALSIMRLIQSPPGSYEGGAVQFDGRSLLTIPEREMRAVRGGSIAMIFQEPMTSLNPVYSVGAQVIEAIRLHRDVSRDDARESAIGLLKRVGIPAPESNIDAFPHQLSGGMRQRVMIAMALSCEPKLLIADEPTTALDVTIQAQILDLIARLQRESGMAVLLITHDLSVVAEHTQEVAVMYAGQIVEHATTSNLFAAPEHPYTRGLLGSLPRARALGRRSRLPVISGMVPDLANLGPGCRFAERCPAREPRCDASAPPILPLREGHWVRCFRAGELEPWSMREAVAPPSAQPAAVPTDGGKPAGQAKGAAS
jgi:oligopeptide/dipeptide ABC transporter ATP-binding protein